MVIMEDSGFDDSGDVRCTHYVESDEKTPINRIGHDVSVHLSRQSPRNPSNLQKKIERRIEQARKNHNSNGLVDQQPRKGLIPISRLHVPGKNGPNLGDGAEQPLVTWIAESSEDEYEFHPAITKMAEDKDITNQLRKDGFNLDLTPDDEDLDLIPPRPLKQNCSCCNFAASSLSCSIQ